MATKKTSDKKLSTTNLMLVTLLVCVVVLAGGVLAGKHLWAQIKLNQKVMSKKSTAAHQLAANLVAAPTLIQQYNAAGTSTHQEITDALPTSPDIPGFVAMLENITNASGVSMRELAPDSLGAPGAPTAPVAAPTSSSTPLSTQNSPTPLLFDATLTGSYAKLLQFLSNLQLSARPIQLTSLVVSGSSSDITADLTLTTYYETAPSLTLGMETIK